jgi:hypothetical protein
MGTTLKNWSFQHSPSIPPGYQFADGDQGIFTFAKRALAPFLADVEAEKDFTQGCRWLAEKSQAALSLITPKDPELASRILEREPSRTRNNPTH